MKGHGETAGTSDIDDESPAAAPQPERLIIATNTLGKEPKKKDKPATVEDDRESPPSRLMLAEAEFRKDVKRRRMERDTMNKLLEVDEQEHAD